MTERRSAGWFEMTDSEELHDSREAIETGTATEPADWPALAVESGFAGDETDYYETLHTTAIAATRDAVERRERADDQQLIHAVRAMDDLERHANELSERLAEWAPTLLDVEGTGLEFAREIAARDPTEPAETRLVTLANRVVDLAEERVRLETSIERRSRSVAPNLAMLAGPVLAARLLSLAGGLEELARKPSGTVQVLGAEDALFAHLSGTAPSPKHGVIFTHDYVSQTHPAERGSAARALAGKLAIASRIDYYSGDRRPELADELDQRMHTIRARRDDS